MSDILNRLRATRDSKATIVFPPDVELLIDAIEIADSCARSDIECSCKWTDTTPARWYDTASDRDPEILATIAQVVRYLEARGQIERNAEKPHLVRFVTQEATA